MIEEFIEIQQKCEKSVDNPTNVGYTITKLSGYALTISYKGVKNNER